MDGAETGLTLPFILFWGIVTFSLVVVVHEGGHFLAARLFGVKVHEFMLGLPGPALRLRTRSTTVGVTAVPLGGYVRISGMDPGPEDPLLATALKTLATREQIDVTSLAQHLGVGIGRSRTLLATLVDYGAAEAADDEGHVFKALVSAEADDDADALLAEIRASTFRGKKTWQRVVILGTGVLFNLLFAILTFSLVLSIWGYPELTTTIERVMPDTAAARTDLASGDVIVALDGEPIDAWEDVYTQIAEYEPGDEITITVERDERVISTTAELGESEGLPYLGIESRQRNVRMPFFTALRESIRWTGLVFVALWNLFQPDMFAESIEHARGIVGVSVEAARAVQRGPVDYAWIVALLSLSLGALNIFPIPPLDGGKIVFEFIQKIIGRPIGREWYLGLSLVGALAIFALIGYVLYADFARYVFTG